MLYMEQGHSMLGESTGKKDKEKTQSRKQGENQEGWNTEVFWKAEISKWNWEVETGSKHQ